MVSLTHILSGPLLIALAALSQGSTASSACCQNVGSKVYHEQFVKKWLAFWDGDVDLLDELAAPDMVMYQDRVPSPSGNGSVIFPINSSEGLIQAMAYAFAPYEEYHFDLVGWAGTANRLAVRWTMNGVLGSEAPLTVEPGTKVSVNGTDFIFLDSCTGLINRYDLAQDNLDRYHQFGFTSVPV